jgi:Asp-tRNA(Asn)/Glu-tRNA(Gln) amidotransferase A subunit family amidase
MPGHTVSEAPTLTASVAVHAVAAGKTTVAAIADEALRSVDSLDPDIGAFRIVDADGVRRQADDLDAVRPRPLNGVVLGVKDVIDTADLPTGYGSPLFADHQPSVDADVVASCRRAGALILGKTESTEFAMFHPTRTRNPRDLERTPGGSSSGSAAAVAAGMVPIALGTQTAGSVIRPAAYCGVYGFKPTRGWTSTAGVWRLTESFDTIGIFARTVADLALTYQAIRAADGAVDPVAVDTTDDAPRRVAVLNVDEWAECEPDVALAIASVSGRLRDRGWDVRELAMPDAWRDLPEVHSTLMAVEVARNMRARLGADVDQISPTARAIVERGDSCPINVAADALSTARAASDAFAALAASTDLLLAPSALGVAPKGLEFTGDPVMCRPWTLLCAPATNLPAYFRPDGLPVGVQAVGVQLDDVKFITALASLEAALADKE